MHPISMVKGDWERAQVPTSNGLCPHVASPWDGRALGDPIWGMLLFVNFCATFFREGEKWLDATSRRDMGLSLGTKSHVSLATLVRSLLAMARVI